MAWNEPGGNNKDPWGGGNRGNDGPPDLDEVIKNLQDKVSSIFGGGGSGSSSNGKKDGSNKFIIAIVFIVLGLFYIYAGASVVNEQERAVVLRLGEYQQTKGPGFRWNPPGIDEVFEVNVTKVQEWSTTQQMLTHDLNIVDISISTQYVISDARDFVLNVRDPETSLRQAANSALRHVAGSTPMHDILTEGREAVATEVAERLQAYLDNYKTGIKIETVNIENSRAPSEVQAAFDDVIKAREDEERYKNEAQAYSNGLIPEARGKAQRMIEEATAYKERVVARAEGEAQRFEYLLTEYAKSPQVTRERLYLDAVQEVMQNSSKVMVDVEGGNNMLYLPLDKIVSSAPKQSVTSELSSSSVSELADKVVQDLIDRGVINTSRRSSSRGVR
ncbi:FtsH protease activity modulator HflK [Agaribacterium haliotis]|uniref:FtsH protease activity modulator HflK n=1 Tax=Agaribacterium haliotis TaxID=2013869 RepID=UPI000BB58740|nr:FtsH protease activity modulator HflK [Agaribacterium haliotis]